MLLVCALSQLVAASDDCDAVLKDFYAFNKKEAAPAGNSSMVYFLHIPRTAGRSLHFCFLKQATHPENRCPKAYDQLRIDFDFPACQMMSSHDDFSIVQQLPMDVSIVTQMRDPVKRFISAYEFAIEVAAGLVRRPADYKEPKNKVLTTNVWPWSHLVPFFINDIKPRVRPALLHAAHVQGPHVACAAGMQHRGQTRTH